MKENQLQIRNIEDQIYFIRGQKVMLDTHLAVLYGVKTKVLSQAVKRNIKRFPSDFMFQLTPLEAQSLRSQIVTIKTSGRGRHRKYLPYAFSENGVAMLSSVLRSERAIQVNIQIMRAFTKLREWLSTHRDLQEKIKKLEGKFNKKFAVVFKAIQLLLDAPEKPFKIHGFKDRRK